METTPYYWGKKKPDSKKFNILDYILSNNYGENLAKSISLSIATSASDSAVFGKIPTGTGLGIGMHAQLIQGKVSNNVRKNLTDWYESSRFQNVLNSIIQSLEGGTNIDNIDEWMDETLSKGNNKTIPDGEKQIIKALLKKKLKKGLFISSDLDQIRKLRNELDDKSEKALEKVNTFEFPLTREGFMLEFSFAHASVAPESRWENLKSAKTCIWLTPTYRFNVNKDPTIIDFIDLMSVIRLTINNKNVDSTNYLDAGGKLQWVHNRLSFSGEAILRYLTKKPAGQKKNNTFRTAFTFSYKMNELVTFQATFGSNFDGNSTKYSDPSKMFAVGGFNFGFSNFFKPNNKQ
jgi:hypothetical protein